MKFINKKNKINSDQKGFTLIETLVAIFILLISTTGPLTFTQSGLRSSFLARDQVTAFYLAQDAIEIIKNLRDNEGLNPTTGWLDRLDDCKPVGAIGTKISCNLDINTTNGSVRTTSCAGGACSPLRYDSSTRQFLLAAGDSVSKYTRTIYLTELVLDRELEIVVEVSWESNFFGEKRIVAHENIYNWVQIY